MVHKLPVRVFLFNNHSHGIQKQTLETWLNGRYVCVDPTSGLSFPSDFSAIARAMGLRCHTIAQEKTLAVDLKEALREVGPVFVNVEITPDQKLYPVLKHGSALENQMPKLDPKVIEREMIIPSFESDVSSAEVKKQSSEGW
jgi:acetolactate synthase-1/2/3 large subunit